MKSARSEYLFFCFLLLAILVVVFGSCQPKWNSYWLHSNDLTEPESTSRPKNYNYRSLQNNPNSYIPDADYPDHFPMRHLRMNIHFMNNSDSTANFKEGQEAIDYVHGLLKAAHDRLREPNKVWLPPGNDLPGLPKFYRYVLTPLPEVPDDDAIYFHYDDELFYFINKGKNRNNYNRAVINKYAIQKDSVINVFIMPHHPDSILSPTYRVTGTGIALGNHLKIAGLYENNKDQPWAQNGLFNHEVGHILGLRHAWGHDGCEDTPTHPNCWNRTDHPPCDTMASNNVMDYNAHQSAWSPCQIGTIHRNLSRLNSRQRKLLIPVWCELNPDKTIWIKDTIQWSGSRDLEGHLIIEKNGVLTINCRISLPRDAKIVVKPGGKLILDNAWLHNDCGDEWAGIQVEELGELKGEVLLKTPSRLENIANFYEK